MFFGVCNFEAWMTVDSVNNIPAAVDSVGVTDSISGHYVIHRPAPQQTNVWHKQVGRQTKLVHLEGSTRVLFLSRCCNYVWMQYLSKTLESSELHLICPSKVDIAKLIVNVPQ